MVTLIKEKHLIGWLPFSEVQFIIIMEGHGVMQASMVLATESGLRHWAWLEHI